MVGTLSLISLVQALFNFGVAPILEGLLAFYSGLVNAVFWLLQYITPFEIPRVVFYLWTLSFIGGSAYRRAIFDKADLGFFERKDFESPFGIGFFLLVVGFTGLGLLMILYILDLTLKSVTSSKARREMQREQRDWAVLKEIQKNLLYVIAGCVAFYALGLFAG